MASPVSYLPPALTEASIQELLASLSLPKAARIEPLQVTAAFHSIYILAFGSDTAHQIPSVAPGPDGSVVLVLRVSGRHFPRIKTANEVGVMKWVRSHTSIPVPAVVKFDDHDDNVLGHEYTLLEKVPGTSVDKLYNQLDEEQKRSLIEQLADFVIQLHSQPWSHPYVGGLVSTDVDTITEGPPMEETFWMLSDVDQYWSDTPVSEDPMSLNPLKPVHSWTSYIKECLERYVYAIQIHPSLVFMRELVPQIQSFAERLTTVYREELDKVSYVLGHKDLHFANIMCDPATMRITGILDWEFASVVPAPRWNPVKAFLWNTQNNEDSKPEKERLYTIFEDICRSRDAEWLLEQVKMTPRQEAMSTGVNYLRAIVEVCPKGQRLDKVPEWKSTLEEAMRTLGDRRTDLP
ncbi:kinase-like protein [Thozetella sp. PMI_491]|nr:kinase-like protein [Thozetella sp. PMI_491]